jgi:hypothetical protein
MRHSILPSASNTNRGEIGPDRSGKHRLRCVHTGDCQALASVLTARPCEFKSRLPQLAPSAVFSTLHSHLVTHNEQGTICLETALVSARHVHLTRQCSSGSIGQRLYLCIRSFALFTAEANHYQQNAQRRHPMATMSATRIRSLYRRHTQAHEVVCHFSTNSVRLVVTGFSAARAT